MSLAEVPFPNELHIKKFASEITHKLEPIVGPVLHRPEKWAVPGMCFKNVSLKVQDNGGEVIFGWTFHYPSSRDHLRAAHHAVWHAPDGTLVDITPFDDSWNPLMYKEGLIAFLVNNDAKPLKSKAGVQISLLSKFYVPNDDKGSLELKLQLELKEAQECEKRDQDILSEDAVFQQVNIPLDGIM